MPLTCTDFTTWAPAVSAMAASVAAIVAMGNVVLTNRNARRSRAVDLLHKKEQEFDTPRMRRTRKKAALALGAEAASDVLAVDEVMDFMDGLARMVLDEDLDARMAWHSFYHWFMGYADATSEIRVAAQLEDKSIWKSIDDLLPMMQEIQTREGTERAATPIDDRAKFLRQETELDCD